MVIGKDKLLWIYERMRLIREFEERLREDFAAGKLAVNTTTTIVLYYILLYNI